MAQNNKSRLISPTKETYLTSRTNNSKFSENLQCFRNNVPMYLFDIGKSEAKEENTLLNKFRDNQARVRSTSPNKQTTISSFDQLNTTECREAIYELHGIISCQ